MIVQGSIYSQDATVLKHQPFLGKQYILTLHSPQIARTTQAGQFVHLQCGNELLMRRPISVMSVNKDKGSIDLLYKIVGAGTELLSQAKIGDKLPLMGPIGNGFCLTNQKKPLLLGGGVGMPPIIAIAQSIKDNIHYDPLAILGSEVPFPFEPMLSHIGPSCEQASYTMPLLEHWGIACRLTSLQNYEGVYQGYITDLAKYYLDSLSAEDLSQVEIFACGPHLMLKAVAQLAKNYHLPCQASLEEYMACAVGGCAGCVVPVKQNNQTLMKRVCVDGPVFEANTVFYD